MPAPPPPELARRANGQFGPNNKAAARRALKRVAKGVTTLNPDACAPWLARHVDLAARHGLDLATRVDDATLNALCGAAADALAIYRGLVTLGDPKSLTEARGWLREYRTCLVTLAHLAATRKDERPDYGAEWAKAIIEASSATADEPARPNAHTPGRAGRRFYEGDIHEEAPTPGAHLEVMK